MSNWIIVILCAVAAVALFVAGMSLTLMLKGHHIDSEISTNKQMQRRGIKCAVQETREAMQQRRKPITRFSALRNPSVSGHGCGRQRKSVIFDRSSDVSGFAAA